MKRTSCIVFIVVLLAVMCQEVFGQATAVISGPETASPGDLVILDASSSDAVARVWILANSQKSYLAVEDGKKCVFASGAPGEYIFILSTAKGDAVAVARHVLKIDGVHPAPNPVPPVPPVPPGPVPPTPTPNPPSPPAPELTGIAKQSFDAAMKVQRKPGEAATLSDELATIGGKAAGLSWTVNQIAAEVRKSKVFSTEEAKARWAEFNKFFSSTMQLQNSVDGVIEALDKISIGLKAAEDSASGEESLRGMINQLKGDLQSLKSEVGS